MSETKTIILQTTSELKYGIYVPVPGTGTVFVLNSLKQFQKNKNYRVCPLAPEPGKNTWSRPKRGRVRNHPGSGYRQNGPFPQHCRQQSLSVQGGWRGVGGGGGKLGSRSWANKQQNVYKLLSVSTFTIGQTDLSHPHYHWTHKYILSHFNNLLVLQHQLLSDSPLVYRIRICFWSGSKSDTSKILLLIRANISIFKFYPYKLLI